MSASVTTTFASSEGRPIVIANMRVSHQAVADFLAATNVSDRRYRFGHAVSDQYAIDCLARSDHSTSAVCAVCATDRTIFGIANVVEIGARCAELALLVRSDHQNFGIGTALVRYCAMEARSATTTLVSFVGNENSRAMRLLTRCGFKHRGFAIGAIEYELSPECCPSGS